MGAFHGVDDGFQVAEVTRKGGSTGEEQAVGAARPAADEFLLDADVALFLKLLQMRAQGSVGDVQALLQGGEVESAVDVQEREDTQSHRAVDDGIQSIEVNLRWHGDPLFATEL